MTRNPTVTVRLTGGLGNQLFQYALGRAIALECSATVTFDASSIAQKNGRQYALDQFNTTVTITDRPFPLTFTARLLAKLSGASVIREQNLAFMTSLFSHIKKGGNFYLDGYWQTEEYFHTIRPQLLTEITLKTLYAGRASETHEAITSLRENAVSLHVRRGDYVTNTAAAAVHGGICDARYYAEAIANMRARIPSAHFFVFSDDIAWVKENLGLHEDRSTYVSGEGITDAEELILMSECAHHIIANSSFSWWGAWLNPSEHKMVIAPKKWFNESTNTDEHIVPASWIRL